MFHAPCNDVSKTPIAVGGVGGSGTRLIAGLLRDAGVFMGDDLNGSCDLLWFTLLFKYPDVHDIDDDRFERLVDILVAGLTGGTRLDARAREDVAMLAGQARPQHPAESLRAMAESLLAAVDRPAHHGRWGWKEPNTHVVIERLWRRLPELRYVHVVRNGADMAFSGNQNQLALWGPRVLGDQGEVSPRRSLRYWCQVHRRIRALLAANPQRMYWLDYDNFCRNPHEEFESLRRFLALPAETVPDLSVVRPPGEPRHAHSDLSMLAPSDLAYVSSLGYRIERRETSTDAIT
jgi:hypothetical protein